MIPHHESGDDPIARVIAEVRDHDVFIDLGSGEGKVAIAVATHTRARVRGIEIQPALVERARQRAREHNLNIEFVCADARDAQLEDGTIFYMYLPFTGPILDAVMARLRAIPHPIVVCALGVDLSRFSWLRRREIDEFWLEIYDAV